MSGCAPEAEAGRARPLSGGLWALISWLRRDDSGASSDSLSSVGSDRTVASFAFLAPERYRRPATPVLLPPPGPPTDSYKRRLRDRNSRLRHDRDLTLHRKYGLFRGENGSDAFSLPPARKSSENDWGDRERRAASECSQRRAAHVPGKRRAPPPPGRSATLGPPRRSRKRPAPQPPRRPLSEVGGNAPIPEEPLLFQTDPGIPPLRRAESMNCKPEKCIKKEVKDSKPRAEKSFLKQIFEIRKRNSTIDAIPERLLPSISELDKQAAEIIETCKLKALERGNENTAGTSRELVTPSRGDMWFCTRCLRKYDDSVVTCGHCVTEQKMKLHKSDSDRRLANRASNHYTQTEGTNIASTSGVNEVEEKQKLKEMLKEIKDSLPKRPKHDANDSKKNSNCVQKPEIQKLAVIEAPTLRIGTKITEEGKLIQKAHNKAERKNYDVKVVTNTQPTSATETAVVTQPIVLQHLPSRDIIKLEHFKIPDFKQGKASMTSRDASNENDIISNTNLFTSDSKTKNKCDSGPSTSSSTPSNIPLKISSLLNSSPIAGTASAKIPLSSQSVTQQQRPSYYTKISGSEAQPLVSSSKLLSDSSFDVGFRDITTAVVSTPAAKLLHNTNLTSQEQTSQQSLKATSTTQTSSNVLFDIAAMSKPNTTHNKDRVTNNKSIYLEPDPKRTNAVVKSITSSTPPGVLSSTPQPSVLPSALGPPLENHEINKEFKGKQQRKSPSQNAPCKISGEGPKVDTPRIFDNTRSTAKQVVPFDLHSRRRDLINQLEQSIAKGDERAAADAAAKLAQLKISCSVLSFSSQIVGAPSTSLSDLLKKTNDAVPNKTQTDDKVTDEEKLKMVSTNKVAAASSKITIENKALATQLQSGATETNNKSVNIQRHKINDPSTSNKIDTSRDENVSIEVWIEDREAARGPIRMNMPRRSVMGDLRRQANESFGLAAHLQRWIVGKTLCTDDNTLLTSVAGPEFDAPFYLCLVEPDSKKSTSPRPGSSFASSDKTENKNQKIEQTNMEYKTTDVYAELVLLERRALVSNAEEFECGVCMDNYQPGQGAVLRECVHTFCKKCLSDVVKHSEEPAVSCPAMGCPGFLQEREIRALVSLEEYEKWLARGLAAAESGTRNAFHCRTADCQGWALCEPGVTRFPCPVCKRTNCVSCQAIHEGDTCEQYRAKQRAAVAAAQPQEQTDEGTRAFLDTLISRGEALECPECSAIITKKWGCDWIKCSACKTEICWVTRGRRWGPGGRGDTSAGCRCGVDGKRCHPSCGYCH